MYDLYTMFSWLYACLPVLLEMAIESFFDIIIIYMTRTLRTPGVDFLFDKKKNLKNWSIKKLKVLIGTFVPDSYVPNKKDIITVISLFSDAISNRH